MPTAISTPSSPPRESRRSSRRRKVAAVSQPSPPVKPPPSTTGTRPIRDLPSRRISVCIPSNILTRKNSTNKSSSSKSKLTRKSASQHIQESKTHDSKSGAQSVQPDAVGQEHSTDITPIRAAARHPKNSRSVHHSSKRAKTTPSQLNQSTNTTNGKTEKRKKPRLEGNNSLAETSNYLNQSQLREIEEKITSTSNLFSDASLQELNSKPEDPTGIDYITRVDERCFEVLKDSELDERSDQSDDELIPSDHDFDQVDAQLPSSFQSPKRLSSVSPLGASARASRGNRRSARKAVDNNISSSPKRVIPSATIPARDKHTSNASVAENPEIDQDHFPSTVFLPLLHGLLSHLSGLKPLPIRIPKELMIDRHPGETHDLDRIQSVIDQTPCLVGHEELELELRSILFRSVSQHEGNVLLLCGARGSGKTALVSRSLSLLSDPQTFGFNGFITIKLNGLVHNNDKIALKEMCRQLFSRLSTSNAYDNSGDDDDDNHQRRRKIQSLKDGLEFNDDDSDFDPDGEGEEEDGDGFESSLQDQPKFSNYGEILKNLLDVLEPAPSKFTTNNEINTHRKALIIVLEEFDMFSDLDRQSFLYCLLDSVQGNKRKNGICVIGNTSVVDCLDRLEKRVKSRCQSRIRYLNSPKTQDERIELLKSFLELSDPSIISEPSSSTRENQVQIFIEKWNEELAKFLSHSQVHDWLDSKFQLINTPLVQILQDLNVMISTIVYEAKRKGKMKLPILKPIELYRNSSNNGIDSKAQGKKGMPERRLVRSSTTIFSSMPWWSKEMSTLEFSVLIACKHLSSIHHNGIFNLEMAWDLYRQHLKRLSMGSDFDPLERRDHQLNVANVRSQIYGRDAFELAWERLKKLEIIIPISMLNSRVYSTTPMTSISTNKNKKYLNGGTSGGSGAGGGGGGSGKGYELVKFVPFLTQIDLVISHLSTHLLSNHLTKWAKNSTD